ncbi:MAG: acetamidase/formamidase family protein [Syntrophaceae bacterium]|nr:acetamidase/formamidase family protein [Syntrophaceae bacterium]
MEEKGKIHRLAASPQTVHTGFYDSTIPPVLTIESGDTVRMSSMMLMDGRLHCGMTLEEMLAVRQEYIDRNLGSHTLTGPIFIQGAKPGDVLKVRIQKLVPAECGVNYHFPEDYRRGGLPEDFPAGDMRTLYLDLAKMETLFAPGIVIPLKPFFGNMGVAPRPGEKRPAAIPDYFGGNMDNKELVAGSILYLPVQVPGALFSAGDAHAAQGDGEVNVTAIETAMKEAVLQFFVRKDMKIERPMGETPTHWITMAFHPDLDEATETALRDAIRFLSETRGLTPDEAYSLCSLAVDLRITQIVDDNKGVHAMIPKSIFREVK